MYVPQKLNILLCYYLNFTVLNNSVHLSVYNKVTMKLHLIDNKVVKEYIMINSILKIGHIKYDKPFSLRNSFYSKILNT